MFQNLLFRFFEIPRIYKRLISASVDGVFMLVAMYGAFAIRVDNIEPWLHENLYLACALTAVCSILVWGRLGLYRAVIRFIDTKVLSTVFLGAMASGIILIMLAYTIGAKMPRSIPFIYVCLVLIFAGGSRLMIRGLINVRNGNTKEPVIIYGAGSSGRQLALSLQAGAEYNPVAFFDDNKEMHNSQIAGLKVYSPESLSKIIDKYNATKLLLAIPSASLAKRKNLLNRLEMLPVKVMTIPGSADLVSGKLTVDAIRQVDIEELLGREPVAPIERLFRRCIENRHVMVTGAGGSIGSELCRQIVRQQPLCLVLLESSEFALYSIEKELGELCDKYNHNIRIIPILGSVVDQNLVENLLKQFPMDTIYHAAAYKHVPLVEHNMVSGLRNNVFGTMTAAKAAAKFKVKDFVLVSTDKAVRPTNVMGASKRLSELVLQALALENKSTVFTMVRFGNVLGSSGSVVPLFKKLIKRGGPVTVTHPDITRYFMTIPEAAQLVIQAGAMGGEGNVYVLDMGEPIKINDLAIKMVHLMGLTVKSAANPGGDIEIQYSGLRPGEKLYEELLIGENVEGTEHSRIMRAKEVSLPWDQLTDLIAKLEEFMAAGDMKKVRELLLEAPLGYQPSSDIADCIWFEQGGEQVLETSVATHAEHLRVVEGSK